MTPDDDDRHGRLLAAANPRRANMADAAQLAHDTTFYTGNRRPRRSQQECACDANMLERLPDDSWLQRTEVSGNVR